MVPAILNFFSRFYLGLRDVIREYDAHLQQKRTGSQRILIWLAIVSVVLGVIAYILISIGNVFNGVINSLPTEIANE